MPHLQIEYTANLDGLKPDHVLVAAMAALAEQGLYDMPTAKGRIRRLDHHATGHPDSGAAFVGVVLAVLPGRSPAEQRQTSAAITQAVAQAIPQRPGTQVRTDIRLLDERAYTSFDIPW